MSDKLQFCRLPLPNLLPKGEGIGKFVRHHA
jgi:hypothetical protein